MVFHLVVAIAFTASTATTQQQDLFLHGGRVMESKRVSIPCGMSELKMAESWRLRLLRSWPVNT